MRLVPRLVRAREVVAIAVFAKLRQGVGISRHHTQEARKVKTAVFTISRNEGFFLPRWLKHYGKIGADVFVLDHESNDGSTAPRDGVTFIQVEREKTDDVGWMLRTVETHFREFCLTYQRVIFAEVDEFLVPDPALFERSVEQPNRGPQPGALARFLSGMPKIAITAGGWDVCQRPTDAPLNASCAILGQRGWKRNFRYDKTLIASAPLTWEVGFHRTANITPPDPNPGLLLVHLHYADREVAWNRLVSRMAGREPAAGDWGYQNKTRDRAIFDRNFDEAIQDAGPIPDRFKEML